MSELAKVMASGDEDEANRNGEGVLRGVALAVSRAGGEDIFRALVQFLAVSLDMVSALIAVPDPDDPLTMRALALYEDGRFIDGFSYSLVGSPCAEVFGQTFRCIVQDVQRYFPDDVLLVEGRFDSYAAFPLFDSQGQPLGLIAALDRKPLTDPGVIESMMRIFAARAGAELERRRAVEALRASEEQYRAIFDASVDGLALWDEAGRLVDLNPAFAEMHGYERREAFGLDPRVMIHPDHHAAFEHFLASVGGERTFHVEARDICKDGRLIDVDVLGVSMVYRGRPHILGVVRDITARKQAEAEREQLQDQLRQAQKMEAIGQLTGGIAHDFNNILSSVMGYLVMALERQQDQGDETTVRYLERALRSGERARDLIGQMLTFSRGQRLEPRPLPLAPLVEETVGLLASALPAGVTVTSACPEPVPRVMLDPVQLEQVLVNLCINARDALGEQGRVIIHLRPGSRVRGLCASCRLPVRGEFVELTVADDGPGIEKAVLERMFEPFFSTKEAGKGSGMGLAMVHGIVHEHGGHILVETAPGCGSAFRILLPPVAEPTLQAPPFN